MTTCFIFVDFENVPKVDLALIEGKAVHVTLLLGKTHTKLPTEILEWALRLPGQVATVRLMSGARDALDIALAFYLGQTLEKNPGAQLAIVSKDKGFDPLIAHLAGKGTQIARHDGFAALPFLQPPKPINTGKSKPPFKVPIAKAPTASKLPKAKDKFSTLVEIFRSTPQHCPKKLDRLLHVIETHYSKKLPEGGAQEIVARLEKAGILKVVEGRVICLAG